MAVFDDSTYCARCEQLVAYSLTVRCTWCDDCLCEHCVVRERWICAPCDDERADEESAA